MRRKAKCSLAMVVGVVLAGGMPGVPWSEAQVENYRAIVDRNTFGLKPVPAPPPAAPAPPPRRAKLTVTGITTILGDKRVLLKASPPPGNPGEPATHEQDYIIAEGRTEDGVEVVRVDEVAATVTVKNGGVLEVLKLARFGASGPAALGPPPPPAVLPVPAWAITSS
jgi:hypothetical protein